jgi:uncharacterized membrane protein
MHPLVAAFLLGIVAGMRAFTAPAVLVWFTRGGIAAIILGILALTEYFTDLLPNVPARTSLPSLIARLVAGGVVGYIIAGAGGLVASLIGVLAGAYGGLRLRLWLIARVGAIAAGLAESAAALLVAAYVVKHL